MSDLGLGVSWAGTGTATIDSGKGILYSVGICAGADAATATFRTGGSGGTVLCKVGAGIGLSNQRQFRSGVPYSDLHVTVTGTTPQVDAELG